MQEPRHRRSSWRLTAAAVVLLTATMPLRAQTHPPDPGPEQVIAGWSTPQAHPLTGHVWLARDGRLVNVAAPARHGPLSPTLTEVLGLRGATHVLLGEVHDNPQHHLLRASLVSGLAPVVVSEHISEDQRGALDTFLAALVPGAKPSIDEFFKAMQWDRNGWPDQSMFRSLYMAALPRLRPGNVARERIRAVARGGAAALAVEERSRYGLDVDLPTPLADALNEELRGSHCGLLPERAIPGMAVAQRLRDAHLAAAMLAASTEARPVVLLAGNGHVRTDRGVPWHLRQRRADGPIVSVMLVEVSDGRDDPLAYVPRAPDGTPAADAIVLTPRAQREDPCESMRNHMQKKG
jgi:uncharacterized iron-regulated protein